MRNIRFATASLTLSAVVLSGFIAAAASAPSGSQAATSSPSTRVERGKYLVSTMGCNDCHTPWQMGPKGPEPDMTRSLNGHPAAMPLKMPELPKDAGWQWVAAATNTAFAGPWGVSFAANLTPDKETGLGDWTVDQFIATMKTGRHQGKGRQLLPPMPWPVVGNLNDEDIRSLFAYLQSLPPVSNRVPQPIDPPESR
jgi:cytochrome c553